MARSGQRRSKSRALAPTTTSSHSAATRFSRPRSSRTSPNVRDGSRRGDRSCGTPTLRAFCAALEDGSWDDDSAIVPLQSGGSRPPLFVVHGLMDEVFNVAALKRSLGADQPLYAIRARPDRSRRPRSSSWLRDTSRRYRTVHRRRPVPLCRHVLGRRARRRAHARSAEPGSGSPARNRHRPALRLRAARVRRALREARREACEGGRLGSPFPAGCASWGSDLMQTSSAGTRSPEDALAGRAVALRRRYRLRPLPGTLTVLRRWTMRSGATCGSGLPTRCAGTRLPSPHATIFLQPHADVLGECRTRSLREADRRQVESGACASGHETTRVPSCGAC